MTTVYSTTRNNYSHQWSVQEPGKRHPCLDPATWTGTFALVLISVFRHFESLQVFTAEHTDFGVWAPLPLEYTGDHEAALVISWEGYWDLWWHDWEFWGEVLS